MTSDSLNIKTTGLPYFDTATGLFNSIPLTAKGDLLTFSTDYAKLTVGANGTILKADSGETTGLIWENVGTSGSLVFIESVDCSSTSSVDFDNLDTTTYRTFYIFARALHPQTDNVNLQFLYSTDNGSTFLSANYQWVYELGSTATGTYTQNQSTSSSVIQMCDTIGNAAGEGVAGWIWFFPSDDATKFRHSVEWSLYSQNTATELIGLYGSGINSTTSAVNAIRINFSSGNIESGSIYLYGLTNS